MMKQVLGYELEDGRINKGTSEGFYRELKVKILCSRSKLEKYISSFLQYCTCTTKPTTEMLTQLVIVIFEKKK